MICTKCSEDLPEDQFAMRREGYRRRQCKACRALAVETAHGRDPQRATKKKTWGKAQRERNRGHILALQLAWRGRYKEYAAEYQAQWRRDNPERVREYVKKRRAKKRNALIVPFNTADLRAHWVKIDVAFDQCFYCDGAANTTDHVIPLSLGGPHAVFNLVPACISCNSKKGTKLLSEWHPEAQQRFERAYGISFKETA